MHNALMNNADDANSHYWAGSGTGRVHGVVAQPPPVIPQSGPSLRLLLIATDVVLLLAVWVGLALRAPQVAFVRGGGSVEEWVLAALAVSGSIGAFRMQGMYRARVCNMKSVERACLVRATAGVVVVLLALAALTGASVDPAGVLMIAGIQILVVATGRALYRSWLASNRRAGRYVRPVILAGANAEAASLYEVMLDNPEAGVRVCGYVAPADLPAPGADLPWLGDLDVVAAAAAAVGADGVIIAASAHDHETLNQLVRTLLNAGLHVQLSSGLQGLAPERIRAGSIAREPMLYVESSRLSHRQVVIKRTLDVLISATALLLGAPVMLMVAAAVKLHDRGPVFFRQERVGRDGVPFMMYKFRSMVPDAERLQANIAQLNARSGPLFKAESDPRVTPVGRLIRATSLDELPQLINVLNGSMSLVGPRPALPSETEQFDEALQERTRVLPGITGLWQVEARDSASFSAYRRLDLFYLENWSISLDLTILAATATAVLRRALRSQTEALTAPLRPSVPATQLPTGGWEAGLISRK